MSDYTVILADGNGVPLGVPESLSECVMTFRKNSFHTVDCSVSFDDALAGSLVPDQSRIMVYRNSTAAELALDPDITRRIVYHGYVPSEHFAADVDQRLFLLKFFDHRYMYQHRIGFTKGPQYPKDVANIVSVRLGYYLDNYFHRDVIDWGPSGFYYQHYASVPPGLDMLYLVGGTLAGGIDDMPIYVGDGVQSIWDAIQLGINSWNGFDCDVTFSEYNPIDTYPYRSGTLVLRPKRSYDEYLVTQQGFGRGSGPFGSDKSGSIVLSFGPNIPTNCVVRSVRFTPVTNSFTAYYSNLFGGAGGAQSVTWSGDGKLLREKAVAIGASNASGALAYAQQGALYTSPVPVVEVGEILPGGPRPFYDFGINDILGVEISDGGISVSGGKMLVQGFRLTITDDGKDVCELVAGGE